MSKLQKTTLATALLLAAANVSAAGFQVNESSASGLGRAFAGEAAVADNASVIARNPAAMSRFDRAELSIVGSYIKPNGDIKGTSDASIGAALGRTDASALDADNIISDAAVPAFYYIQPINDKVAVGLAMFSGYGMVSEYDNDYVAGAAGGKTDLKTFNINPSISYKTTEKLSLGLGVNAVYAKAILERNFGDLKAAGAFKQAMLGGATPTQAAALARANNDPSAQLFLLEGDAWGYGWNIGALYEFSQDNRIGLAYRSKVDLGFEGDFTGALKNNGNKTSATLDLTLPATAEFSGYHKLTQTFAVSYSALWTQWSEFSELKAESSNCGATKECFSKDEKYDDNMRYSVGAEYYINDITLRTGFAYDEQAGETTLSIPDTDRYWYTVGATYKANQDLSFDFAAAYIFTSEVNFKESTTDGVEYGFEGKGDAYIASAQMNYRF